MKEYANKNFALGAARKVMGALSGDAEGFVIEYGPEPTDPANPEGKYVAEFVLSVPLESLPEADRAALAESRVIVDPARAGADEPNGSPLTAENGGSVTQEPAPEVRAQEVITGNPSTPPENGPQGDAAQEPTQPPAEPPATPAEPRQRAPERMEPTEVTGYDGRKVAAEIPIGAGRKRLASRNGVSQPGDATFARLVWNKCDEISAAKKRPALPVEVRNALADTGIPGSTISTEYRKWATFWDVTDEMIAEVKANLTDAEKAEIQAAESAEMQLKRQMREMEKQAKALEREAEKEEKRLEREQLRAAKSRSAEEAAELKRKQKSEEAAKKREERLAKNKAIAEERAAAAAAKQAEKLAERQKRLEALQADFERRQAEAKARLEALANKSTGPVTQGSTGSGEVGADKPESGSGVAAS